MHCRDLMDLKFRSRLVTAVALVALASPIVVGQVTTRMKEVALRAELHQMRNAINRYYADTNEFPKDFESLVRGRYMSAH